MTRQTVSNWERGRHEPTERNLSDIARALGMTPEALRSFGGGGSMRERATVEYGAPPRLRIPPAAYQLVFDYCESLERAGVPEEQIDEARRLMSGETFNTLRKHMLDERTEEGWVKDVKAAWAFIKDTLRAQGFDL